jgi:WD40-like Beta Propeller Repeat
MSGWGDEPPQRWRLRPLRGGPPGYLRPLCRISNNDRQTKPEDLPRCALWPLLGGVTTTGLECGPGAVNSVLIGLRYVQRVRFGAAGLAAFGVFLLAGATASSAPALSDRPAFYRLRTVSTDGRHRQLLFTSPVLSSEFPRWEFVDLSPDRKRALMFEILPTATAANEASDTLYLADIRGRPERLVVPATSDYSPWGRWSADGARFVYETFDGGRCGAFTFWLAARDGGDLRQLGSGQLFAWGPGHDSFAIERGCSPDGPLGPLVFTDRLGQEHVLARGWVAGMAISPRGDRIAYETYGSSPTLHIARTDGSGDIAMLAAGSSAAWSPDGRRLAFVSGRGWVGAIAIATADGGSIRTIVPGRTLRAPAWSPDGRLIAYARDDNVLETIAPNGRGRQRLARTSVLLNFWWSPDSRRIYYDGLTGVR